MRQVAKLLAPLKRRVRLMIGRGVLKLIDDSLKIQGVQVSMFADETLDDVERFQQYGFTSHPHPEAEAIVVSLGGQRSHSVVIAIDDRRYRLKNMARGEVAMYTDEGDYIHFKRGNIIAVKTSDFQVDGKVTATGDASDANGSMQEIRDTFNSHTHPGDSGGTTGAPNQQMS